MDPRPVFRTQIRKGIILVRYGSSRQRCQAKAHERDLETYTKSKAVEMIDVLKEVTVSNYFAIQKDNS